jgi:porin
LLTFRAGKVLAEEATDTPAAPTEWQVNYRSAGNRPGPGIGTLIGEGPMGGIWQRSQLLGDPFEARSWLGKSGLSLNFQETSEVLGNVTGGIRQGATYDGLTTMNLQADSYRALGYRGGLFNASALWVHGVNLSASNLATLQTSSGIEADSGIRLWELWYQQSFFYNQADVKIGNQSLDQEFMVSQYANLFLNTMFGWPMLPSADMLSGGPAYPLASLGARLRVQPSAGPWTFLVGVFNDNPSGISAGSHGDPQQLDAAGANFRLGDGPLVMAEIQYSRPALGELEYAGQSGILPASYKLGAWYDFGKFADQQTGSDGLSLANPASNGSPQLRKGNYSIYAVVDQLLWRESPESEQGVGFFFRGMVAPADRNLVTYSLNAGVTWREPIEHRENDVVGIGFGRANISYIAAALDQQTASFTNIAIPIRSAETFLELTYQYQIVPWWQIQPDVQYVFNPGGGISNPSALAQPVGDELVVGLRTNITL